MLSCSCGVFTSFGLTILTKNGHFSSIYGNIRFPLGNSTWSPPPIEQFRKSEESIIPTTEAPQHLRRFCPGIYPRWGIPPHNRPFKAASAATIPRRDVGPDDISRVKGQNLIELTTITLLKRLTTPLQPFNCYIRMKFIMIVPLFF